MGRGHAADTPRSYQCKYRPLALAFLRNAVERRSAAELRRIPQVRRGEFRKTQTQGPNTSRSCSGTRSNNHDDAREHLPDVHHQGLRQGARAASAKPGAALPAAASPAAMMCWELGLVV